MLYVDWLQRGIEYSVLEYNVSFNVHLTALDTVIRKVLPRLQKEYYCKSPNDQKVVVDKLETVLHNKLSQMVHVLPAKRLAQQNRESGAQSTPDGPRTCLTSPPPTFSPESFKGLYTSNHQRKSLVRRLDGGTGGSIARYGVGCAACFGMAAHQQRHRKSARGPPQTLECYAQCAPVTNH